MDESRVAELEAKVAELTHMVERLTAQRGVADAPVPVSSRRTMLRNVALAAGGAVAATVAGTSLPAAADDIVLGSTSTTPNRTVVDFVPGGATTGGAGFLFQAGNVYDGTTSATPSTLSGWTTVPAFPNGVYGFTTQAGSGVVGVGAAATSYGVRALGGRASVLLTPNGAAGPARGDAHATGELLEDDAGNLWLCTAAGTPGVWRKLAGPASAGAFHAIAPVRVYDSRLPSQPGRGKLVSLQSRLISVADGRDQTTGEVNAANVVPAGATAIVCNLTVTDTQGPAGGFLSMVPGDAVAPSGSSINWFGPAQNIANGITARLDGSRQVRVFAGGGGNPNPDAHFIIDVNGYFL
jgi:hypothetical protein